MKKLIIALASLAVILCMFNSCCTPKPSYTLDVALRPQETSMWCWAASGQMCMQFLGKSVTQCDEANKQFGRSDCCNSPVPGDCVNGGWPEFAKYNFKSDRTSNTALSWDALKKQIYCSRRPVAYCWPWTGGGGHMMVALGYSEINAQKWVLINNPWAPNVGETTFISYDEYVSASDHTHWDDFYNITKQ
jgi:hypothetical protein